MPDQREGISLKTIVGGVLQALREAKHMGDLESAKLGAVYRREKDLSSFTIPAFALSDVEIELRFAIAEPSEERKGEVETPDLRVHISPEFLKGLEAHHVSVMKLKITPISFRVFEESP